MYPIRSPYLRLESKQRGSCRHCIADQISGQLLMAIASPDIAAVRRNALDGSTSDRQRDMRRLNDVAAHWRGKDYAFHNYRLDNRIATLTLPEHSVGR